MSWKIAEQIGYTPITTYWDDFTAVEKRGSVGVRGLARDLFETSKQDYKVLTELAMVLNHKSWEHAVTNTNLSAIYSNLYYIYDEKAIEFLQQDKEGLHYYFKTLD